MNKSIILFLTLCFFNVGLAQTVLPSTFIAKVIAIKDGDTFKVLYNNTEVTIRLNHIDCPEKKQPFGNIAKQKASELCFGQSVKIISEGKNDRYNRLIAEVYCNNLNINKELVKLGLAWHFKKYSNNPDYAAIELKARYAKIGLWQQATPIAPWDWRKLNH